MPRLTPPRVLILGGTTEGRALAAALTEVHVISSLAGRTSAPLLPPGEVRVGGFGGVDGLARYLREQRIDALVDATHPFAATMTGHAVDAAARTGVPVLVLRRPGWVATAGDRWHRVPSLAAAATALPQLGRRVFLTTGRQSIAAFAALDGCWFLARSVEPPTPPAPRRLEILLDRGPFTVDSERRLLAEHRIDVLVSKDSGGAAAKLTAAREAGLPVLLIDRPPAPAVSTVATVDEARAWVERQAGRGARLPHRLGDHHRSDRPHRGGAPDHAGEQPARRSAQPPAAGPGAAARPPGRHR